MPREEPAVDFTEGSADGAKLGPQECRLQLPLQQSACSSPTDQLRESFEIAALEINECLEAFAGLKRGPE